VWVKVKKENFLPLSTSAAATFLVVVVAEERAQLVLRKLADIHLNLDTLGPRLANQPCTFLQTLCIYVKEGHMSSGFCQHLSTLPPQARGGTRNNGSLAFELNKSSIYDMILQSPSFKICQVGYFYVFVIDAVEIILFDRFV
jgi:hypothetical protein